MVEIGLSKKTSPKQKIEISEEQIVHNDEFRKNVAIPYLKDIYKDLASQSDQKSKGINRVTMLNVSFLFRFLKICFFSQFLDLKGLVYTLTV